MTKYESVQAWKDDAMNNFKLSLLADMIAAGVDPTEVAGKLRDLWTTLGIVGALLLTLISFGDELKCPSKPDHWFVCEPANINAVHVILSSLAMASAVATIAISTMFYALLGLLPPSSIERFIKQFSRFLAMPSGASQFTIVVWLLDVLWKGLWVHGSTVIVPVAVGFALMAVAFWCLYVSVKGFVKAELTDFLSTGHQGAEAEQP